MAMPTMLDSASGVSTTRSSPNCLVETLGGVEHAAVPAHVLAQDHHPLVAAHGLQKGVAHRFRMFLTATAGAPFRVDVRRHRRRVRSGCASAHWRPLPGLAAPTSALRRASSWSSSKPELFQVRQPAREWDPSRRHSWPLRPGSGSGGRRRCSCGAQSGRSWPRSASVLRPPGPLAPPHASPGTPQRRRCRRRSPRACRRLRPGRTPARRATVWKTAPRSRSNCSRKRRPPAVCESLRS